MKAFTFYTDKDKTNRQLDQQFQQLRFQNPIRPGTTQTGFVLVNLDESFKAVDIDLLADEAVKRFSFIFADPDFKANYKAVDSEALYTDEDIIHIEDEEALRRVNEALPCCTANAGGNQFGDPLNIVLIGEVTDILHALIRRNRHPAETTWSKAIKRVGAIFDIRPEEVCMAGKRPRHVDARSVAVDWCVRELGISSSVVEQRLNLSRSAVSRAAVSGRQRVTERSLRSEEKRRVKATPSPLFLN